MKKVLALSTALIFTATIGFAAINTDALIADYQAQGYTRIEVKTGPTQTKIEAIRGTEKVEVIYDSASGAVLKSESGTVAAWENSNPGVEVDNRNRDFVRIVSKGSDDDEDHDENDDHGSDDDGDSHDDDDHGDDDHDSGDDDNGDDDSGDHDGGDDHGSDHDGGGDDSDGDN